MKTFQPNRLEIYFEKVLAVVLSYNRNHFSGKFSSLKFSKKQLEFIPVKVTEKRYNLKNVNYFRKDLW
ncbi:MAG TPA: hypothetical protein P5050_07885 [Bacteroidia bacterium]|nr:hypothetical protein [Bacteroidia bacterium]HRS59124.1 hypothetical protein [Bacteroidia bacterium]HRU67420.1 hypothetical protein [Bacteroidia bacterium]